MNPIHSRIVVNQLPENVWKIKEISSLPKPVGWVKRESSRFLGKTGPYIPFRIPYLDHLGRNTSEHMYTWVTTLQNYSASYVATVSQRLRSHIFRMKINKKKKEHGLLHLCVKVAALTFISGSNYLLERFIALASKRGCFKIIHAIIRKFVSKLDDNTWFVFRHISSQIKWIDLRARNGPRDKSKLNDSLSLQAKSLGRSVGVFNGMYNALNDILKRSRLYA
jgi:hypothetical protein